MFWIKTGEYKKYWNQETNAWEYRRRSRMTMMDKIKEWFGIRLVITKEPEFQRKLI